MIFYILFILILLSLFLIDYLNRKQILPLPVNCEKLAVLVVIFVGIFRFDVGWDYVNYYNYINLEEWGHIIRLEPLSIVLCVIAIYFNSPPLLFVLFGLPTYYLFFRTLKKNSKIFALSFFVYLAFFYLETFTSIRQTLALSIVFAGYKYILKRKFISYVICVVIAFFFHYSALVAIAIYPIYHKFNFKLLSVFILGIFIFKQLMFAIVERYTSYGYYLDKLEDYTGGGIVRYIMILFFIVLLLLGYKKGIIQQLPFYKIVFTSLILPFILGPALGARLGIYFSIYLCLLCAQVFSYYHAGMKLLLVFGCCCYFLLMIYIGSQNDFKSLYIPYQFIFDVNNIQFR